MNITVLKHRALLIQLTAQLLLFFATTLPVSASGTPRVTGDMSSRYVPAAAMIEHFDFEYALDPATGVLSLIHRNQKVTFIAGSSEVYVEGRIEWLSAPVLLKGGQLLIPGDGVNIATRHLLKKSISWTYSEGVFAIGGMTADGGLRDRSSVEGAQVRRGRRENLQFDIGAIVIDPGHGGSDPGGVGVGGIKEKDIVLAVAQELRKELLKSHRSREIIISREQDDFLTLEGRSSIANGVNPEKNPIFISIHANASFNKGTFGYETYFLSLDPVSEDAREVAMMENSVFTPEIEEYNDNLRQILNRIVDVEYRRESIKLAEFIQRRLEAHIGSMSSNRGVKSAFFYVLKAAKMPSVLVEIGFVTNREESSRLLQTEYRKKIAKGVAEGINDFITLFQKTEGFTKIY